MDTIKSFKNNIRSNISLAYYVTTTELENEGTNL